MRELHRMPRAHPRCASHFSRLLWRLTYWSLSSHPRLYHCRTARRSPSGPSVSRLRSFFGVGEARRPFPYLTLPPGRAASREHLVDLLWSDRDVGSGRHSLRLVSRSFEEAFDVGLELIGREALALTSEIAPIAMGDR